MDDRNETKGPGPSSRTKLCVLVIGGTHFMGKALVTQLLSHSNRADDCCHDLEFDIELSLLNRGRVHWEKETTPPVNNDDNSCVRFICDREDEVPFRSALSEWLSQSGFVPGARPDNQRRLAIVDFCAYTAKHVQDVLNVITADRAPVHYVFISSDSVYEVCNVAIWARLEREKKRRCIRKRRNEVREMKKADRPKPEFPRQSDDGSLYRIAEYEAVRPPDPAVGMMLAREDEYGHNKLAGEELLQYAALSLGVRYTSLRLSDVFGPYDNTDRHWNYQLWLALSSAEMKARSAGVGPAPKQAIPMSCRHQTQPLSFVFADDVARAIIIALTKTPAESVYSQCINLALSETPSLHEYLKIMCDVMGYEPAFLLESTDGRVVMTHRDCPMPLDGDEDDDDDDDSDDDDDEKEEDEPEVEAFLPSTTVGMISISKAEHVLAPWRPTPLRDALKSTCTFFEHAWAEYPHERPDEDDLEESFGVGVIEKLSCLLHI